MALRTKEPGTQPRPGDLLGRDLGLYSEFDAWTQEIADRYGVSILHARVLLRALRGEVY